MGAHPVTPRRQPHKHYANSSRPLPNMSAVMNSTNGASVQSLGLRRQVGGEQHKRGLTAEPPPAPSAAARLQRRSQPPRHIPAPAIQNHSSIFFPRPKVAMLVVFPRVRRVSRGRDCLRGRRARRCSCRTVAQKSGGSVADGRAYRWCVCVQVCMVDAWMHARWTRRAQCVCVCVCVCGRVERE
jgi:hypothetical protein